MLRRLHLILAALAVIVAPIAMQSGMAMAAMPMDHHETAKAGHCGDADSEQEDKSGGMTQCCVAMCSAVAPLGAASIETIAYRAPLLFGVCSTAHRAFLAELPTPPPRTA
jgi:hypothetical protein